MCCVPPYSLAPILESLSSSSAYSGKSHDSIPFVHDALLGRRLIGRFYFYLSIFVPSVVGTGCALLVERPNRRPLLAGYVATVVRT